MASDEISASECGRLLMETMQELRRGWAGTVRQWATDQDRMNSMAQLHVLGILDGRRRSLRELAAMHRVTPSSMSRSVEVLVRKGWVARQEDPDDRRQVILQLTKEGKTGLVAVRQLQESGLADWLGLLDGDECARLYDGLQVLHSLIARTSGGGATESDCERWTAGQVGKTHEHLSHGEQWASRSSD